MGPQVNWHKLKAELNKLADLDKLKAEVHRLGQEILKFDVSAHLSPTAKERLKTFEGKYHEISKTINKTQRQVDREVNRVLRNLKEQRTKAEKSLELVKSAAKQQRRRIEKASLKLKDQVIKVASEIGKPKKKRTRKKATHKTTAAE